MAGKGLFLKFVKTWVNMSKKKSNLHKSLKERVYWFKKKNPQSRISINICHLMSRIEIGLEAWPKWPVLKVSFCMRWPYKPKRPLVGNWWTTQEFKLRRKKGNFIWAELRIITQETDSISENCYACYKSKARSCKFSRQRIVHHNGILTFYIKFTKDTWYR